MKRKGFTLLEVLIAATLSTFVALVAVTGFQMITSARKTVDQAAGTADALRYTAGRIERDLASVVRGEGTLFEGLLILDEETAIMRLRMHVHSTDKARTDGIESDRYEVEYMLGYMDELPLLVRRVCPIVGNEYSEEETDGGIMTVLSESIVDFQVRFYDGSEWVEEWFLDDVLPQMVVITLTAADPEFIREQDRSMEELFASGDLLQRTIWMYFPGEGKISKGLLQDTENEESANTEAE